MAWKRGVERRSNLATGWSEAFQGEAPLPAIPPNTLARGLGVSPKVIYDLAKIGIIERSSARLFPRA